MLTIDSELSSQRAESAESPKRSGSIVSTVSVIGHQLRCERPFQVRSLVLPPWMAAEDHTPYGPDHDDQEGGDPLTPNLLHPNAETAPLTAGERAALLDAIAEQFAEAIWLEMCEQVTGVEGVIERSGESPHGTARTKPAAGAKAKGADAGPNLQSAAAQPERTR